MIAQFCPAGDRAELILDAGIAEGRPAAAIGSLAHEARHSRGLALAVRSLSCLLCVPAWVLVATWALPWPATLTPAAAGQVIGLAADAAGRRGERCGVALAVPAVLSFRALPDGWCILGSLFG